MDSMRLQALLLSCAVLAAADRYPVPPVPADLAAPPVQAVLTPSGLASVVLRPGTGADRPGSESLVTVEFTLWTQDGKLLDSTARHDGPFIRPMTRLLKGMAEGLQLMTAGEKRRFWLPPALGRPPGMLVLELELVEFGPSPFKAPADVAGPGEGARILSSGLAMKVLRPGKGTARPSSRSRVEFHYTGWTTDGRMFDSSWTAARSVVFALDQVIRGWSEALQLMNPGEKVRLWVPEKLAYRGEKGMPAGMLVFDVELLEIL
jgi:peptidylprolyl isomerase